MTDNAPHPGWWLASDGRYYPPELHDDQSYREHWAAASAPAPQEAPTAPTSVADLYPSAPPTAPPSFGAATDSTSPERLVAPQANVGPVSPPVAIKPTPPANWPEGPPLAPEAPFDRNRIVGIGLFALAAVAITGAFLPWVSVSGETIEGSLTGWQRNDGKATVAIAVVLAGLAGLLFVGWKSAWAKVLMIGSGVALVVLAIVDGFNVVSEGNEIDTSTFDVDFTIGLGSWVTVVTGVLLVVLAFAERSPWTRF